MRVDSIKGTSVYVTLSRRNLMALLAKLDGYPVSSECEIARHQDNFGWFSVKAEEDDVHYNGRVAGPMHPDTESRMDWLQNA